MNSRNRRIGPALILGSLIAVAPLFAVFPPSASAQQARQASYPDPSTLVPGGYQVDVAAQGDLYGNGFPQLAILSSSGATGEADVWAMSASLHGAVQIASFPLTDIGTDGMFMTPLTGDGRQQLVVWVNSDSEAILTYNVYSWTIGVGEPQVLLSRPGIGSGTVQARSNGLLEQTTHSAQLFTWDGSELIGTAVTGTPPAPLSGTGS